MEHSYVDKLIEDIGFMDFLKLNLELYSNETGSEAVLYKEYFKCRIAMLIYANTIREKANNNFTIDFYKKMLLKYDEQIRKIIDIMDEFVHAGYNTEKQYMDACNQFTNEFKELKSLSSSYKQ